MNIKNLKVDPCPNWGWPQEEKNRRLTKEMENIFKYLGKFLENNENNFWNFVNRLTPTTLNRLINVMRFYDYCERNIKDTETILKTIFLFSTAEGIVREKIYQSFDEWLWEKETKKRIDKSITTCNGSLTTKNFWKVMEEWKENYLKDYGVTRSFRYFFENHILNDDKIKIIRAYKLHKFKVSNFPLLSPVCWKKECENWRYSDPCQLRNQKLNLTSECDIVPEAYKESCQLKKNQQLVDKTLKEVVKLLYDRRSKVVHDAVLLFLTSSNTKNSGAFSSGVTDILNTNKPSEGYIKITMPINEMEDIILKAVVSFFEDSMH